MCVRRWRACRGSNSSTTCCRRTRIWPSRCANPAPHASHSAQVLTRYRRAWNYELVFRPFLLGGVMKGAGNKPPGQVPAKGSYMMTDLTRMSAYLHVPLSQPNDIADVLFRKGSLRAMRLLTAAALHSPAHVEELTRQLWHRIWLNACI